MLQMHSEDWWDRAAGLEAVSKLRSASLLLCLFHLLRALTERVAAVC